MTRRPPARKSRKVLVLGVAAAGGVAVLGWFLLQQADILMERALRLSYGDAQRARGPARFEWDGDLVANRLAIYPTAGDESRAIRFERLHLETPGWLWLVSNVADRQYDSAELPRMRLSLEGGRSGAGIDLSLGQLGPIGAASASPFDTEGCLTDATWSHEALGAMGLTPGATTLSFDYRVEGPELFTTITIETRNAGRVQLDRRSRTEGARGVLQVDRQPYAIQSERWQVVDSGFVVARNRYCSRKDEIDGRTFLERHVDSVERVLATRGLVADEESRLAYRRFARDGGAFAFGGSYAPALPSDIALAARADGSALRSMSAKIEQGTRSLPVQWSQIVARPLRNSQDEPTTFAILQRERTTSADIPAQTDDGASIDASSAQIPSGEALTAEAPAASSAGAEAAVDTPTPAVADEALPVNPATTPAASPPTPTVSRDPAAAPAPPPRPARLGWDDLSRYQGRMIRIWTMHNPPRTVQLQQYSANQLRVTARLSGGHAEYTIQRDGFIRAQLVR